MAIILFDMIISAISRLVNDFIFLTILSRSKVINKFQAKSKLSFSTYFFDFLLFSFFHKQIEQDSWSIIHAINNLLDIHGDTSKVRVLLKKTDL